MWSMLLSKIGVEISHSGAPLEINQKVVASWAFSSIPLENYLTSGGTSTLMKSLNESSKIYLDVLFCNHFRN